MPQGLCGRPGPSPMTGRKQVLPSAQPAYLGASCAPAPSSPSPASQFSSVNIEMKDLAMLMCMTRLSLVHSGLQVCLCDISCLF